jgi:hypothetical protein
MELPFFKPTILGAKYGQESINDFRHLVVCPIYLGNLIPVEQDVADVAVYSGAFERAVHAFLQCLNPWSIFGGYWFP